MSKVILITGASSGLGLSIAEYLAGRGYIVYGSSRTIKHEGQKFKTVAMDVCDAESVRTAVDFIIKEQGRIDVVINNAGLGIAGPVEQLSVADVRRVFDTNILGVLQVSQAVLPYMRNQKSGKIFNISSIGAEIGLPYRGAYSASKAAVDRLTEALRMEIKNYGVQACTIQPGGVITDINKNRLLTLLEKDSAYKASFDRTYKIVNDSVSKGLPAETFGPEIEKLIHADKLKRNYRIGKPTEKLSVVLKRILPSGMFEKIIASHYQV